MDDAIRRRRCAYLLFVCLLAGCYPVKEISKLIHMHHRHFGTDAEVCEKPTVESLARDLDNFEQHLERYGSAVAKQPDVWGQARLTKHRQEFEQIMAAQLTNFDYTLQGTVSQSDQAYFADALALSAAASPPGSVIVANPQTSTTSTSTTPGTAPTLPNGQLAFPDQSDTFGAFSGNNITRTPIPVPAPPQFKGITTTTGGLTIEPAVFLDQRARFLNHLQELRRINEGDDTADSPGYALNLVRIPISVTPGKFTSMGHGAEVTITMNPYLSEELLPTTFRNLVINDLVDQLGFPITEFINNRDNEPYFTEKAAGEVDDLIGVLQDNRLSEFFQNGRPLQNYLLGLRSRPGLQPLMARPEWQWLVNLDQPRATERPAAKTNIHCTAPGCGPQPENEFLPTQLNRPTEAPAPEPKTERLNGGGAIVTTPGTGPGLTQAELDEMRTLQNRQLRDSEILQLRVSNARTSHVVLRNGFPVPATKSRRAKMPFPPSQIVGVYGYDFERLVIDAYRGLAQQKFARPTKDDKHVVLHLPDVQGYLQEELDAAYRFLSLDCNVDLWQEFCNCNLASAVRSHQDDFVECERMRFRGSLVARLRRPGEPTPPLSTTGSALAWAIIVESALLNDRLVQDIREAAAAKGANPGFGAEQHSAFFYPNPTAEARLQFNEYVRNRWPIHVFALDPAAQQQNIAATFSGRREMQLAMSMAFVSGKISARNMMRFARRIEYDFATVDLNSTEIGFSHGNETFGWRFYPRFQTPEIESNATVFFRDLMIGGPSRNALLNKRRLEPGIRECYAVVIMPSFVPYATFNVSSNWFKLTNPKCKQLDSTDAMRLSKLAKNIQNCSTRVTDEACYRDGDFMRLLGKAKQLEQRLPFQDTMVQIPYENTLGGFAMFNTGVTDLAPELTGFYGTEAIDPAKGATVFLVGNHFSVHQTQVIAGGQRVGGQTLLSRQVMQVTIPAGTAVVGDSIQQFIDVQLATPYGVSQHLLIPTTQQSGGGGGSAETSTNFPAWQADAIDLAFTYTGLGIAAATANPVLRPPQVVISPGTIDPNVRDVVDVTMKFAGLPSVAVTGTYAPAAGGYVVPVNNISTAIFANIGAFIGPQSTNPATFLTASADLKFRSSTNAAPAQDGKTSNTLRINFIPAAGK